MAGILQLRRGLKSTYISEGTNLAEAFFVTTAESGSISANNLIVGISGSVGNDVITLAKLSLANKDNSYADYNSGSFWITGDYTGSNALIYDNLKVSGSVFIEEDLHLEGHLYLGSGSDGDVVTVKSDFSGSLIPDNDAFGSLTPSADTAYHDLGIDSKRWRNIYLQKDATGAGFLSGSHIDLTGNIKVDGEGRFGTLRVDDLTDNRILIVGPGGEVEDDENLTYDGQDFRLTNSDYYQSGSGASFQFDGAGMDITGSISNYQLQTNDGIVFTEINGTLQNSSDFTWNSDYLNINGGISASDNLSVDGESTLASAIVKDLTENRIVISGPVGELEDDQYFTYDGNQFDIGQGEFTVQRLNGNTSISGSVQMYSTLNVDDQSTLASLNVEDLTDNRVVIVGAGGEIEDDGNFTFDGDELNIGTGNFTVQQGSGNTQILGTLDVDGQSTLASLNIEDLTDNRIVIVGTSGEIEDDGNLTFNGTELNIGTGNFTVQQGSGNTQIVGTLDVDSQSTLSSLNVQDLTSGRVVLAGTSGEIEDSGNLTFDGTDLVVTGNITVTQNLTVQGDTTQLDVTNLNVEDKNILLASGAVDATAADGGGITIDGADATLLYGSSDDSFTFNKLLKVNGNISGSSFNGTTLLSSSNENFADYSQSVDLRLDNAESSGSDHETRVVELESTGSDHETRIDEIETTFSSSVDSRLVEIFATGSDHETRVDELEAFSSSLDDTFATEAELNSATSSLSSSLAVDIASNLSEITNLNSFSESIESHLPEGTVSGSDQLTSSYDSRYVQSGSITGSNVVGSDSLTSIETITSASYAAITPVSGTLYIIVD